ncbi:MAG: membrane protein insertase YidC [Dermatophilus congolensis]|nr:membrane protein insertase YidC [Dermatophilus congolensis]
MPTMPAVLMPFAQIVALLLAAAHTLLTTLGLAPDSGATWVLAIAGLTVAVRTLLLPLTVHGVKLARSSANARPALDEMRKRYEGRTDLDSLRAMREEQLAIQAEHGVPRAGCLPMLLQLPILFALYGVLSAVARGDAIGAMDASLVSSLGSAHVAGVGLAERLGSWGALTTDPTHLAVIVLLALTSAGLSYATMRWFSLPNMVLTGMPAAMVDVQKMMPMLSALGLLFAAAAVPVGLLVYWVASNAYTLVQQAVVTRWFPTPGSPAHDAWLARHGTSAA